MSKLEERRQRHFESKREAKQEKMEMFEGQLFEFVKSEYHTKDSVVIVSLMSNKGEEMEEIVVRDVGRLVSDTQYAGAISPERVSSEVTDALSPYDIEEGTLEEIIERVKEVLEGEKGRFNEE